MATRKFCDYCDALLSPENSGPFVRELAVTRHEPVRQAGVEPTRYKLQASVVTLNEHGHMVEDICHTCQLEIVNGGTVVITKGIATMQQPVASDTKPPVSLFGPAQPIKALPVVMAVTPPPPPLEKQPPAEETVFVPSAPPLHLG